LLAIAAVDAVCECGGYRFWTTGVKEGKENGKAVLASTAADSQLRWYCVPYLTLQCGSGILPPNAEVSSGPSAHPHITAKSKHLLY